jgi:dihydropteroate synthase
VKLRCRHRVLALDRVAVMGVINVTPDSFSDGGLWADARSAIAHGVDMVEKGADILDVGGESTRPGATPVPEEEELRRVLPVIDALAREVDVPISIDTRKARVARSAVAAGATVLNETSGEAGDGSVDAVAADSGAALVLMHSRGTPATMGQLTDYADVVGNVAAWLRGRAARAEEAGVPQECIAVDPGYGFAKDARQSLALLRGLRRIVDLPYPVLVGTSRKSFIGSALGLPIDARLEGTAATVAWAVSQGAAIVRVHDVEPMVRVVRMIEAIMSPEGSP